MLHGEAVAIGMICEVFLSNKTLGFDSEKMKEICQFILSLFPKINFNGGDIERISELAEKDKKSVNGIINGVLLKDMGIPEIDCQFSQIDIRESLQYYLELNKEIF